jgi:membrane protein implicated in regulation of membrane protease activity
LLTEQGIAIAGLQSGVAGMIRIHGEMWRGLADQDIATGAAVRVRKIEGLTLHVEPAAAQNAVKTSS